jgi:threonine dehydrogenase-like Zn-dependent dehydrogenase
LVIGHEPVVRIERITPGARARWGVDVGDRVAIEPHVGCGVCAFCTSGRHVLCPVKVQYGYVPLSRGPGLWGSLADYMVLTGNTVMHRIPDSVSIEDALLFNPLGAGYEWAVSKGGVGVGDEVLIIGAGQRGLACILACAQVGARRIIVSGLAKDQPKLELAKALGATDVVITDPSDPDSLVEQVGIKSVDCVVDVTPAATQPVLDAIRAVRVGGTIVIGGIKGMRVVPGFVSDDLVFKSITMKGALGVGSKAYKLAVQAVVSGQYDFSAWHTHSLPLERAEDGIKILGGELGDGPAPIHVTVTP